MSALLLPAALAAPADIDPRGTAIWITVYGNEDCYGGGGGTYRIDTPGVLITKVNTAKSFRIDRGLPDKMQLDVSVTDDLKHWADATEEVLETSCNKHLKSYTNKDIKKSECVNTRTATCWLIWENKDL
ncbi:hypothetical protein BDW69DRAFT_183831 [Aspergillus filifer]